MAVLNRPEGPEPGLKNQTSPSIFEEMRLCFLRCAFGQDVNFSQHQIPNPASVLGTASHRLYEELWRGTFLGAGNVRNELEKLWEEEVTTGYSRMKEAASGEVPEPKNWPFYQMKRMSTILDINRIVNGYEHGHVSGVISTQAEAGLVGHDGLIAGWVDVIHTNERGTEIVDYKTGRIFDTEESSSSQVTLKPAYERQLLIYSDLYHEMYGEWPVRATIFSLYEGSYSITPDPDEAAGIASEAIGLLERFNDQVKSKSFEASPSEEACLYCRSKAVCPEFLERSSEDWKLPRTTIRGKVTEIDAVGRSISLNDLSGNTSRTDITVVRVPAEIVQSAEVGDTLSFSDLGADRDSTFLDFRWWTQVWKWS